MLLQRIHQYRFGHLEARMKIQQIFVGSPRGIFRWRFQGFGRNSAERPIKVVYGLYEIRCKSLNGKRARGIYIPFRSFL